ncbi:MAG: hypothetical protein ACFFE5_04110 [Candidatus Thorarchaeota archaeon]
MLLNGLVVLGVLILSIAIGALFYYKSRQYDIKMLSYLAIMIFFMGFMWLGPIVDFVTIVFTTVNMDNSYGLYSLLSYVWVPIPLVFAMLISAQILVPSKKWYIVSIYLILGIIFELFLFFDTKNSFLYDNPEYPGWSLIDARFNITSPAFVLISIFDFSVLLNGIGFLRKGVQTKAIIRRKNWYISIGFFIFVFFTMFDIFAAPGFSLYLLRIGVNFCFLFFYLGLKEESVKPKELLPKKQAKIEDSLFFFTEKPKLDTKELVDEEPVVLLIIKVGGVLTFSYSFVDEWERNNDMLGSFLSAFSSFSDVFFSEEFDRAKFGKYTVLMEAIPNFSVCYLFKGQTYLASRKLSKFTEQIQKSSLIWQTLEKYYKTNQVLELKDCPSLKPLIIEIFKEKNIELDV